VKILFDQGTPAPLRRSLQNHEIITAFERGWQALQNGDLLNAAEAEGFAVIVTTDKNLRYQQNLVARRLAIMVLMTTDWRLIRQHTDYVAQAIAALTPGAYIELPFPPL
jgi:predicted nuclease of predicted toxin-antitoxin system